MYRHLASSTVRRVTARVNGQQPAHIAHRTFNTTTALRAAESSRAAAAVTTAGDSKSDSKSDSASSADQTPALKPTPEHTPTTFKGIIDKYGGLYPLLGLGAAVAVTKELLILNEEFLMVSNFAAVVLAGYVMFSDTVIQQHKEQVEADKKVYEEWGNLETEGYKAVIAAHKRNLAQAEAIRYVKNQYNRLIVEAQKAKVVQARVAARDALEKRLGDIAGREQAESSSKAKAVTSEATSSVKDFFRNADRQVKQQLIDNAIQLLSGGAKTIPADRDPIKQQFLKYFKEHKA